jgi:hypothetical protein
MKPDRHRLHHLFCAHGDGTISPGEHAELQDSLRNDAEARRLWFLHQDVDAGLQELARSSPLAGAVAPSPHPETARRFAGSHLMTAAAALVLGFFSASFGFGFAGRSLDRAATLLHEGFESGPAPLATGVPPTPDQWSGDYSEIVPEVDGLRPGEGLRMARLLRSDYEGRIEPRPSRQGDLMRLIDVRPYLTEAQGADVVMTLSAQFNAGPFPDAEHYTGMVTIYALGAETDLRGATEDSVKKDALAFSVGFSGETDRDPDTWQTASTRLLLPPGADKVMVKVSFCRMPLGGQWASSWPAAQAFTGHFVDDVRASIRIRESAGHASLPSPSRP